MSRASVCPAVPFAQRGTPDTTGHPRSRGTMRAGSGADTRRVRGGGVLAMSHDTATVYRAYLALWNAATEADRRRLLTGALTENAHVVYPAFAYHGVDDIIAGLAGLHERWPGVHFAQASGLRGAPRVAAGRLAHGARRRRRGHGGSGHRHGRRRRALAAGYWFPRPFATPRIGRVPSVPAVEPCSPLVRTSVTLCAERPPCAARTNTRGHALSALPLPPSAYGRGYVPIYDIQGSSDEPA